jgi:hypothetical protein
MKNKLIVKNLVNYALIGIILICIFSSSASASLLLPLNVLDIQVTESVDLTDQYNGVTLTQGSASGEGHITITNKLSTTPLYDVSLNFIKGITSNWSSSTSGVSLDTSGDDVTVNINSLAAGGSATITYDCTGSRPLVFSESYNTSKIIMGGSVNASLKLKNNAGTAITGIKLVKTAADQDSDSTADFTFSDVSATSGTPSISSGNMITWNIPTLTSGANSTLNFTATENDEDAHSGGTLQSSMQHYLGNATLQFTVDDGSVSGSGVMLDGNPTATTTNFEISLNKEQLSSGEGVEGGDDWGFTPTINNTDTEAINYTISSVNLYVTTSSSLEKSSAVNETTYNGVVLTNKQWTPLNSWKIYNFPAPVPVGWIDVDLSVDLSQPGGQLSKTYSTTDGTYKLIEKIFVVNGYLVEAKKSITKNITTNRYDIVLWVHNLGNLETPPLVYVYDIIPTNFSMVYNTTIPDGSTAVSSPINGYAYWWQVGPLEPVGTQGNETYINYTVEGSGTYRMTDLFVLGIDPSYTQNMQSTPILKTGTSIDSSSGAKPVFSLLIMAVLLLGIIGFRQKRKDK